MFGYFFSSKSSVFQHVSASRLQVVFCLKSSDLVEKMISLVSDTNRSNSEILFSLTKEINSKSVI